MTTEDSHLIDVSFPHLPTEAFACLECGGDLALAGDVLTCVLCSVTYAIKFGVPLLVRGCKVMPNVEPVTEESLSAISQAYGLADDGQSRLFFEGVLATRYHFEDSALDSENNLILKRLGISAPPQRCVLAAQRGDVDIETSFNVRLRNVGECPLYSDLAAGAGYELVSRWDDQKIERVPSTLPVSLPPGRRDDCSRILSDAVSARVSCARDRTTDTW